MSRSTPGSSVLEARLWFLGNCLVHEMRLSTAWETHLGKLAPVASKDGDLREVCTQESMLDLDVTWPRERVLRGRHV
jgi:hypothetical protein